MARVAATWPHCLAGAPHRLAPPATEPYRRGTVLVNLWAGHRPAGLTRLAPSDAKELSQPTARLLVDATPVAAQLEPRGGATGPCGYEEEAVGYPFYHPSIRVRGLPSAAAVAGGTGGDTYGEGERGFSLVYVPPAELGLAVGGNER